MTSEATSSDGLTMPITGTLRVKTVEDPMNTTTGGPGQPDGPPWPRPHYSPCLPVHTAMRFLAADGCEKICVTAENSGRAVGAASDLLRAVDVTPGRVAS